MNRNRNEKEKKIPNTQIQRRVNVVCDTEHWLVKKKTTKE